MYLVATMGIIVLLVVIFIVYKMRVGHLTGICLFEFERVYDVAISKGDYSSESALYEALLVFQKCPVLKKLGNDDIKKVADILGNVSDPKKAIRDVVMNTSAKRALLALKNESFLMDLSKAYMR